MSENVGGRRARKSAPVKNAGNLRPVGRRRKFKEIMNEAISWVLTSSIDIYFFIHYSCTLRVYLYLQWFRNVYSFNLSGEAHDSSLKPIDENANKPNRARQRGRPDVSGAHHRNSTPVGRDRSSLRHIKPRKSKMPRTESNQSMQDSLPIVCLQSVIVTNTLGSQQAVQSRLRSVYWNKKSKGTTCSVQTWRWLGIRLPPQWRCWQRFGELWSETKETLFATGTFKPRGGMLLSSFMSLYLKFRTRLTC